MAECHREVVHVLSIFSLCLLFFGSCRGERTHTGAVAGTQSASNSVCKKYPTFHNIHSNPMVKTNSGSILGNYVRIFGNNAVASFLRIPYAKPPLHEYRFRKADPVEPWKGILETNKKVPPCMQYYAGIEDIGQSPYQPTEDCLFLNVFAPVECGCAENGKLQVLVWIYGGSFSIGSSANINGSMIAHYGKVIVVTMNYRLGVFGLLNGGINEAPGNAGMFDQMLAIQWVRENIAFFGGDPNKITLSGQSSGGISVGLHMISPLSRNLFYRGIMESGSAYSPTYVDRHGNALEKANAIAKAVQCAGDGFDIYNNPEEVVQCLKRVDALILAKAESTLRSPSIALYFKPSIGDEFLPKHPIEAYDSGDFAPVNVLMGTVKDEASLLFTLDAKEVFSIDQEPNLNLSTALHLVPSIFQIIPKYLHRQVTDFYLKDIAEDDSPAIVEALKNAVGDFMLVCPTFLLAEKLNLPFAYWWTYLSTTDKNADWVGVYHGSDVPYVFGLPFLMLENYTSEDRKFSRYIIDEWTHFARTGNTLRNGKTHKRKCWTRFSPSHEVSFKLSGKNRHTIPFPRKEACEFWRPIFASFPTE